MKRMLLMVSLLVLIFALLPGAVLAHPDRDGDGVWDENDRCPDQGGPYWTGGCPEEAPANDLDGDGTPDDLDSCPTEGGPDWNRGCPQGTQGETASQPVAPAAPAATAIPLPPIDPNGPCVLATSTQQFVNMRLLPSTEEAIVGSLNPLNMYPILLEVENGPESWYLTTQDFTAGWVAGWVTRQGGACRGYPIIYINQDADTPASTTAALFSYGEIGVGTGDFGGEFFVEPTHTGFVMLNGDETMAMAGANESFDALNSAYLMLDGLEGVVEASDSELGHAFWVKDSPIVVIVPKNILDYKVTDLVGLLADQQGFSLDRPLLVVRSTASPLGYQLIFSEFAPGTLQEENTAHRTFVAQLPIITDEPRQPYFIGFTRPFDETATTVPFTLCGEAWCLNFDVQWS